jgi:RNA polymerase sigma-70 factor (ECF subfamily)
VEPEEASLVAAAQGGDVRAFEALLAAHEAKVLRVLRFLGVPASDREDVAQEVFVRVFRHLGGFRRGRPFGAWVYRITVNAAHDWRLRLAGTREEVPWNEGAAAGRPASGPDPDLARRLQAGLGALSERERAVFVLRELEGLETKDVARALGITSITVRRHLGLARDRLRRFLEEN